MKKFKLEDQKLWYGSEQEGWWAGIKSAEDDFKEGLPLDDIRLYWEVNSSGDFLNGVLDYIRYKQNVQH